MPTNIKYLCLCIGIILHSVGASGQNKASTPYLWHRVSQPDVDLDGYKGIFLEHVSISQTVDILTENKNSVAAGRSNTFQGILPMPDESIMTSDSVLQYLYELERVRRLRYLHLHVDPDLYGYTFIALKDSMDDATLVSVLRNADALIVDGNRAYWENRIENLPRRLIRRKDLRERLRDLQAFDPVRISSDDFIPFEQSQLKNPVYANFQFDGWPARRQLQKIWSEMFDVHVQDALDTRHVTGVVTTSDLVFRNMRLLGKMERIPLDQATRYKQVLVHVEAGQLATLKQTLIELDQATQLFVLVLGTSTRPNLRNVMAHPIANDFTRTTFTRSLAEVSIGTPELACINPDRLTEIDDLIEHAIAKEVFPGAQVLLVRDGQVLHNRNYGFHTYDKTQSVSDTTLYDLASITKVAATVPALMLLDQQGKLDMDAVLRQYLPETIGSNKASMTLRDMLSHQAGLYPFWPFWKRVVVEDGIDSLYLTSSGKPTQRMYDSLFQWTLDSRLVEREHARSSFPYVYSDMGYFLLKEIVERLSEQSLDKFVQNKIYSPMGLEFLGFHPLDRFPASQIAPSEVDAYFRNRLLLGEVHDSNAALQGGVSGRAGLFSNAMDLARYLQMYMDGFYNGIQYFNKDLINTYTSQQYPGNRRALGWDRRDFESGGNTSRLASEKAFGHTGFTGTSLWADPEFGLIYVFLSNRTFPDAKNFKIVEESIRTRLMDIVYEAILEGETACQCN